MPLVSRRRCHNMPMLSSRVGLSNQPLALAWFASHLDRQCSNLAPVWASIIPDPRESLSRLLGNDKGWSRAAESIIVNIRIARVKPDSVRNSRPHRYG
ncbi:hypothetical protein EV356DRAFT_357979 [Viridothelium virens]|uniref:Uncharacterized protein n=1 Tax=Viridothelium virens TaxID=1048519 RepID=A0A6A6HHZ4_VIRVR|nr:hypothetical protein EV356DRAFT_357979 [Viridothelium virens]